MVLMRKGLISGFTDTNSKKAADIDKNGTPEINDAVQLQQYLTGVINEFTFVEPPPAPENKWDDYTETASADWINFYESSLYNMGNKYRLTKKLEAAENGVN